MTRSIPELAGLATYAQAATVGCSVSESVTRLVRGQWAELRLMDVLLAHLPGTPEWEVKCGLALHQWQHAEHAALLRDRISEMRNPAPRLDVPPNDALEALFAELERSADTVELLTGVYAVLRPAMGDAYRTHLAEANPLVAHPTRRVLRMILADGDDALAWGTSALQSLITNDPAAAERSDAWRGHLAYGTLGSPRCLPGGGRATARRGAASFNSLEPRALRLPGRRSQLRAASCKL